MPRKWRISSRRTGILGVELALAMFLGLSPVRSPPPPFSLAPQSPAHILSSFYAAGPSQGSPAQGSLARPAAAPAQQPTFMEMIVAFFQSFLWAIGLGQQPGIQPSQRAITRASGSQSRQQPAAPKPLRAGSTPAAAKPVDPEEKRRLAAEAASKRLGGPQSA